MVIGLITGFLLGIWAASWVFNKALESTVEALSDAIRTLHSTTLKNDKEVTS